MDKSSTPSLLPIFRSQQQAELLTLILGHPEEERSLTEIAKQTGVAYPSVHREVDRAEHAGLVRSRLVGRTRLVAANTASPYFNGLAEVLVRAFGPPWVLASALAPLGGIDAAYIFGSWAARYCGETGDRPVGDVDVLVLGLPDREALYANLSHAERRLGREIQVTIRTPDWLESGSGSFHATVIGRPLLPIDLQVTE